MEANEVLLMDSSAEVAEKFKPAGPLCCSFERQAKLLCLISKLVETEILSKGKWDD